MSDISAEDVGRGGRRACGVKLCISDISGAVAGEYLGTGLQDMAVMHQ